MPKFSSDSDRYNGWQNYATWGCSLILGNDLATDEMVGEIVAETRDEKYRHVVVADRLKDLVDEMSRWPTADDGRWSNPLGREMNHMAEQMISAGLAEVDWDEIASHAIAADDERLAHEAGARLARA